ncbi:LexA family protein [Streptomyces sp. NBC_00354]|uniref:LexA family protein n=1 Tax=Streptomyces sp. NBC_00354 TaxID=2975723 RepID=UPI002E2739FB
MRRTRRFQVVGDSMIDAAICDGDIVTVRRQDTADHGAHASQHGVRRLSGVRAVAALDISR